MAPTDEEKASFRFGGTRARPRKGIEAVFRSGEVYLKPPGSCKGRWPDLSIGIDVECCDGCDIYILDTCEQVQIADCKNCRIVVGPCAGSVFLMDCTGCRVSAAAKQLRLRDMTDCDLRVYAPTHESVVIETSSNLRFGCWDVAYPGLPAQMTALGWDAGQNHWQRVYDFSPASGDPPNWTLIPEDQQIDTRWCELKFVAEGFAGGSVTEVRGKEPTVEGCECAIPACDGTFYKASWFSGDDVPTATSEEAPAMDSATKPILGSESSTAPAPSAGSEPDMPISGMMKRIFAWFASFFGSPETKPEQHPEFVAPKPIAPGEVTSQTRTCLLQ